MNKSSGPIRAGALAAVAAFSVLACGSSDNKDHPGGGDGGTKTGSVTVSNTRLYTTGQDLANYTADAFFGEATNATNG